MTPERTRDEWDELWTSRRPMSDDDYTAYFKQLTSEDAAYLAPRPVVLELPPRERIGLVAS